MLWPGSCQCTTPEGVLIPLGTELRDNTGQAKSQPWCPLAERMLHSSLPSSHQQRPVSDLQLHCSQKLWCTRVTIVTKAWRWQGQRQGAVSKLFVLLLLGKPPGTAWYLYVGTENPFRFFPDQALLHPGQAWDPVLEEKVPAPAGPRQVSPWIQHLHFRI